MRVENSTLEQVRDRFKKNKRMREEIARGPTQVYDYDKRMAALAEEEAKRKEAKWANKKQKKAAAQVEPDIDPEIAAMMGFGGFSTSKK
jgi:U4/U6.U5 tri-snRNP component SNU23